MAFRANSPIYPTGVHIYHKGDVIVEGTGYLHEGVNDGSDRLIMRVTCFMPKGEPLAETDRSKCAAARQQNPVGGHVGL
jgi:hypothetical protein